MNFSVFYFLSAHQLISHQLIFRAPTLFPRSSNLSSTPVIFPSTPAFQFLAAPALFPRTNTISAHQCHFRWFLKRSVSPDPRSSNLPSTPVILSAAPVKCPQHQPFFQRHRRCFEQHRLSFRAPANFQSTSLFPAHAKLLCYEKKILLSAPAFCQRHHCLFQRHQRSFQQHQPFSPQFSATLRILHSSPRHSSAPAPAGARKCCVEVRRAADNRHVLRRTAENMSKNHM